MEHPLGDAQADTLVPGAGNPLAWGRYAYVNDNPLRYRDPSGHRLECSVGGEIKCGNKGEKSTTNGWINTVNQTSLPPIPQITIIYDENGDYDPYATWGNVSYEDLLVRAMIAEEGGKFFTDQEIDAIGAGWVMLNRTIEGDGWFLYAEGVDNPLLAVLGAGGQVLGIGGIMVDGKRLPSNAAIVANLESYPSWAGGNPRKLYWHARKIAKGILNGSIEDPTKGALFWSDARYKADGTGTEPYPDGRTRFKYYSGGPRYTIPEIAEMGSSPWP